MKKKTRNIIIISAILLVVIICVVFILIRRANANSTTTYQTETAAMGDLTAIVGGTGSVRASQSANLTWQTSGRIASIDVKVGDLVNQGDILATLAKDSLNQSVILAQADLVTAQRNLQNLTTSYTAIAQAQLTLANAQKTLEDARNRTLDANWTQGTQDQIDAAKTDIADAQQKMDTAQQAYDAVANLADDNPEKMSARDQLVAAIKDLNIAKIDLDLLLGKWDYASIAINDAKLAIAQAAYEDALREWNRVKFGPDPQDVNAAQARVDALLATLGTSSLKSPIAGTITEINSLVGDQITAGTPSIRVDDFSHMFVDVQVPEVDITRIKVGQDVTINFDALQTKDYHGKVTEVARAGDIIQGVVNFKVTIEITDTDDQVLPAMTAAVNIVVEKISNVLLIPNRAIRSNNGVMTVYILQNNQAVPLEITLGSSSDTYSQMLTGDVKAGELIILNPPTSLLQQRPSGAGMGGLLR